MTTRPHLPSTPSVRLHSAANNLQRSLFAPHHVDPKPIKPHHLQKPLPEIPEAGPPAGGIADNVAGSTSESSGPLAPLLNLFTSKKKQKSRERTPTSTNQQKPQPPTQPEEDGEGEDEAHQVELEEVQLPGGFTGRMRALKELLKQRMGGVVHNPDADKDPAEIRAAEDRAKYDRAVIDLLDVIDPEVSTLSTLSDLQNSLFVPDLGRYVPRSSYLRLSRPDKHPLSGMPDIPEEEAATETRRKRLEREKREERGEPPEDDDNDNQSVVARGEYLVMPKGLVDWDDWTDEERAELDDYVRHLLHSRKWKMRRTWRGFKHYVSTPLGAFITIYASLLTFWGAAWVLFIIGWVNAGGRQDYFIEICDQILTALFCVVGIGLAPFRTVDTYHMIFIARYHRKALRLYAERGIQPLRDENDLPQPTRTPATVSNAAEGRASGTEEEGRMKEEADAQRKEDNLPPVLTVKEQATLIYHQTRFSKSHTFYRPHETATHRAFPLDLLIVVVCLLDFHSIFQIALGSTTWSISYHESYKKILTTVVLSFSISCNITAGLVISVGNRRSRKTEVVEERLRKAVTEEAVRMKVAEREKRMEEGDGDGAGTSQ